jgi:hypothetical protein
MAKESGAIVALLQRDERQLKQELRLPCEMERCAWTDVSDVYIDFDVAQQKSSKIVVHSCFFLIST